MNIFIKSYRLICYGILIAIVLLLGKSFIQNSKSKHNKSPLTVQAVTVIARPMAITIQAPGIAEAIQSVTVPAQITGILKKINFQPGQMVTIGQSLFEIDTANFTNSLAQTQAILKRDQAQLAQLQADAKRYAVLYQHEFVTKQQYEQAVTAAKAQEALTAADQAQTKQAQLQMSYTKINAPIAGKTGNLNLHEGDLISQNSALITINPLNPIWINFNISQSQLPLLLQYQQQAPLSAKILTEDGKQLLGLGKLNFIDNTVNNQTGTVLLKAEMSNTNHILWPGQLVTVQLILTIESRAVTIPISAIQLDQEGSFVYRVEGNKAHIRRIKLARQQNGLAVVSEGLHINDQVLTAIPPNFSEQEPIKINLITQGG